MVSYCDEFVGVGILFFGVDFWGVIGFVVVI